MAGTENNNFPKLNLSKLEKDFEGVELYENVENNQTSFFASSVEVDQEEKPPLKNRGVRTVKDIGALYRQDKHANLELGNFDYLRGPSSIPTTFYPESATPNCTSFNNRQNGYLPSFCGSQMKVQFAGKNVIAKTMQDTADTGNLKSIDSRKLTQDPNLKITGHNPLRDERSLPRQRSGRIINK